MDVPEVRSAVDAAARKLSPENLEKILLEAYGWEAVPAESQLTGPLLKGNPVPVSDLPSGAVPDSTVIPTDANAAPESATRFGKWAALLVLPIGIAGYFGYRKAKKYRKEPMEVRVTEPSA